LGRFIVFCIFSSTGCISGGKSTANSLKMSKCHKKTSHYSQACPLVTKIIPNFRHYTLCLDWMQKYPFLEVSDIYCSRRTLYYDDQKCNQLLLFFYCLRVDSQTKELHYKFRNVRQKNRPIQSLCNSFGKFTVCYGIRANPIVNTR